MIRDASGHCDPDGCQFPIAFHPDSGVLRSSDVIDSEPLGRRVNDRLLEPIDKVPNAERSLRNPSNVANRVDDELTGSVECDESTARRSVEFGAELLQPPLLLNSVAFASNTHCVNRFVFQSQYEISEQKR